MGVAKQRIPVLVTADEKAQIASRAKSTGLSMGEFMRRAAQSYAPTEDVIALSTMIDEMVKATDRAEQSIDDVLDYVGQSNQRIAEMEIECKSKACQ